MVARDEVGSDWRASSRSGGVNCVEVRIEADQVQVRDSKTVHGPVLTFSRAEWQAFVDGVQNGEFGPPA